MHEILRHLPDGARVLDLGCRGGSFDPSAYPLRTVRLDLESPAQSGGTNFVQGDAASLPFPSECFDAIISNHSLEHFEKLERALEELGRVVKPSGSIYIAVPDSSTFCDRVYRWLGKGGGHVNHFQSGGDLIAHVEQHTGLRMAGSRSLMTSFSFLNRKNRPSATPRKLLLAGGGSEGTLVWFSGVARLLDRCFHLRISLYGWALYFGALAEPVDGRPWSNVCVRCGSGHSSDWLHSQGLLQRRWGFIPAYACPACGAVNIFTRDDHYLYLQWVVQSAM